MLTGVSTKTKNGEYVNEWRPVEGGNQLVHKFSILGTTRVEYDVWEPYSSSYDGSHFVRSHSTVTHHDGVQLGDVTMRCIPATMDAMPYNNARVNAVRGWFDHNREEARKMVMATFPEDFE